MFLITIIIPTYNRATLLTRCVDSVRAQVYTNWELIVVDDGSTDDTERTVKMYSDSRIRYIRQGNAGAATARNKGALAAQGEYIIFLDSDDTVEINWLRELASVLNSDMAMVSCGFKKFDSSSSLIASTTALTGHELQRQYGIFLAGTYLLKRQVFLEIGGFDETLKSGHHTELSIRLIQLLENRTIKQRFVHLTLVLINDHNGEKIRSNWKSVYEGAEAILQKHFSFMRESKLPWLLSYYNVLARSAYALKYRKKALLFGWKAVLVSPFTPKSWIRLLRYCLP